jgi:hypothetical protein
MEETRRLQKWANDNAPPEEMYWKNAYWSQIIFVRDRVAGTLARTYEEYKDFVGVDGTHTSKSIKCPVYKIDLKVPKFGDKDKIVQIWMRYNYYNWNISIDSEVPLTCDFLNTFNDESGYGYCFCEGMQDKKFGRYRDNNQKFTVCIEDDYVAYTFFRCLKKFLGIKQEIK